MSGDTRQNLSRSQICIHPPPNTDKNSILWRAGETETPKYCLMAINRRDSPARAGLDGGKLILAWRISSPDPSTRHAKTEESFESVKKFIARPKVEKCIFSLK